MCGRFAFRLSWRELYDLLKFGVFPARLEKSIKTSFNVAPTHDSPILKADTSPDNPSGRALDEAKWGFVPSWWSQPEPPKHTINARSESAATSPLFRGAFKNGRCIVPVSGFYEWQKLPTGDKQPVYVTRADGAPLLLGGIHDAHHGIPNFAVCTTAAPHGFSQVHDRSPVIVEPENIDRWLSAKTPAPDVQSLCAPAPDGILRWHNVHKAVGNVRNNSEDLIAPV